MSITWMQAITILSLLHQPRADPIAYTMVGVADDLQRVTDSEVINYSAAGFRDFTRIVASDPTMWRDVFLTMGCHVRNPGTLHRRAFALQRAIRQGDGDMLFDHFTRTREIRRGTVDAGQDMMRCTLAVAGRAIGRPTRALRCVDLGGSFGRST